ncbi:OLC1v1023096C1 [Oldenlandia corymbosa var. corymbosa]|uniref:OLC1v1023096C1 n=1 Tax=Oldenlandia corymbosa var. corymbosa TaxID=529605 RepID=A0AAV1BZ91_OLDCO|nr:OLC1v1023096C1 [Oldenlandia corymbosa var. corymbosa]
MAEIRSVGVVGAGQMGSGIAQLAAVNGVDVWLHDTDAEVLGRAQTSISKNIQRQVSKGSISQDNGADAIRRLKFTTKLSDFHSVDLVIEAIVESEDVKKGVFAQLEKIVKSSTILASNTSSISITRLATATSRPGQVIGMHFMNPPPIMKLVEIIRGADTSDQTYDAVRCLAERWGKTVIFSNDYPGFIVNRILMPMINEAFHTLHTGVATKEDIDTGMKLGTGHPMGPLELADFIGLDVCLSILKVLHAGLGDNRYAPCPLLVQYVDAGRLGRKRGIGVYNYSTGPKEIKPVAQL